MTDDIETQARELVDSMYNPDEMDGERATRLAAALRRAVEQERERIVAWLQSTPDCLRVGDAVYGPYQDAAWVIADALATPPAAPTPPRAERPPGIPRRAYVPDWTPAEHAIRAAIDLVENMGASVALTDAVVLLGRAKDRVADHYESQPEPPRAEPFAATLKVGESVNATTKVSFDGDGNVIGSETTPASKPDAGARCAGEYDPTGRAFKMRCQLRPGHDGPHAFQGIAWPDHESVPWVHPDNRREPDPPRLRAPRRGAGGGRRLGQCVRRGARSGRVRRNDDRRGDPTAGATPRRRRGDDRGLAMSGWKRVSKAHEREMHSINLGGVVLYVEEGQGSKPGYFVRWTQYLTSSGPFATVEEAQRVGIEKATERFRKATLALKRERERIRKRAADDDGGSR